MLMIRRTSALSAVITLMLSVSSGALLPAIPEAMILSNLDMIDSRMYMYEKVLETTEEGCLSDYIKDLGTSVYNPNNSIY